MGSFPGATLGERRGEEGKERQGRLGGSLTVQRDTSKSGSAAAGLLYNVRMSLLTKLFPQLSDTVRQRGRSYHLRGAVHVIAGDSQRVEAYVQGSEDYRVELTRDGMAVVA